MKLLAVIARFIGIDRYQVSHVERIVSAVGAFAGIFLIYIVSSFFLGENARFIVVASMGASAVLLFAVPHGKLSQPWPVIGGHFFSAIVGVSCAWLVPQPYISAPLAVGLAVAVMHYLRCIHPPGGATALVAVIGGSELADAGYVFVVTPVLINAVALTLVAIAYNNIFSWRRYPASISSSGDSSQNRVPDRTIDHGAFVYALSEMDTLIDVTEEDLSRIYNLVLHIQNEQSVRITDLELGHYYSNGKYGELWSVRWIVDWAEKPDSVDQGLIYKVVAGHGRRSSGICSVGDFSRWAKHEVFLDEDNWKRKLPEVPGNQE